MKLGILLQNTGVSIPSEVADIHICHIANDSRKVTRGSLFVAVKGFSSDGHSYIGQALQAGAAAVVTEFTTAENELPEVLLNPAGDNRKLLAEVSACFFDNPWLEMKTVGITGTNGKTSTAHMIRWILEQNSVPTGIMGTVGHIAGGKAMAADVTTPDSLEMTHYMRRMADSGDEACVMEVSSHALALERVRNVRFDVAMFTNISQDHLDFHRDMEEYLETKKKLFSLLKDGGSSIVGTYASHWPEIPGAVTFGEDPGNTWRIKEAVSGISGSEFVLETLGVNIPVRIAAPGRFNIYNAAGAIAAAAELGIPVSEAAFALASFNGVPGRMEAVKSGQDFLVAVDYAHTPDALERVLSQGKTIAENRLIAVFGCGGDRDSRKRPLMGEIASREADVVIVTSDNPRTEDPRRIIDQILQGIPETVCPLVEPDRKTAIHKAIEMAVSGDVVIIAGKGHEDYQILGREKKHFDDREHARDALKRRGFNCGH